MNEEDTWSETDETSLGQDGDHNNEQLNRRTIRKLDYVLLPFLCSLFLLNRYVSLPFLCLLSH